ncbi:3-oxoacyl-[acyl-carrier protein] reductase [Lentzea albidocapillata subsp. violacea]|uniref:3-oxoacyl-[acyl-carrier protein] reductase n=1 Tax=Lentzea albidocapillata subsp. violacea TaxID=128104 RepID=A0A1G9DM25_9PSEU|nr:SDR family NAD(P)-dependent oxidoreductase [Lentzea albidocapillata]SDK64904.1 3-oxoacyl-[acyl-carrier protein] reductase [Lentzea albidocapillata subsp. violacea]
MSDFTGKVAVVTGGTRGIGFATARALSEAGATVVLTGRDAETAAVRAKEIGAHGVALDVTDSAAVKDVFKTIAREHGRIDVLVASAGVLEGGLIGMLTDDHIATTLSTNVAGTIVSVQAAARAMMRKRSGSIVLLGSIVGEEGNAGQAVYAASKAALSAFAKSAAKELGRSGIRVNAVAPGVIQTDLIAEQSDEVLERVKETTALRRIGTADEVAKVITFLAGDDASFVTGQVLGIDGGLVL